MGENSLKAQEIGLKEIIITGVIAAAGTWVAIDKYRSIREEKRKIDEFVRQQCKGVGEDVYKRLFDDLDQDGIFSSFPLQFDPDAVSQLRAKCREAGGTPETEPIQKPKPVPVDDTPWLLMPREITEWIEVHATELQAGSLAVAAVATIGAIILSAGSGGLVPLAAATGAALMVQSADSQSGDGQTN